MRISFDLLRWSRRLTAAVSVAAIAAIGLMAQSGGERPKQPHFATPDREPYWDRATRPEILPQPHLAIVNANVIDVRTGRVLPNATVISRDGKIVSVGNDAAPAGAEVIDLEGGYLLPGFMDGHGHVANLDAARRAVESGVTTLKSAGVAFYADVAIREMAKQGYIAGPDVLAAGVFVSPTPALDSLLADPRLFRFITRRVDTPEEIQHLVRVNLDHGVDWIKTRTSERAGGPTTDPRELVYTEAQVRAMVEAAAEKDVPVQAHVQGDIGAAPAILGGVRMIEHGWYLSEESLRLMRQHGTYWDPTTPALMDGATPHNDYDNVVTENRAPLMISLMRRNIRLSGRIGVKLVTGTDTPYSANSVSRIGIEIANFVEFGLTPLAALQAATIVSAEAYRLEKRTGAIEPGLEADLVAFDRNPLEDIMVVHDPVLVVSNGRIALARKIVPPVGLSSN